jgi:inosine/xanthosine triphosphate pyrophosphatase family protein
MERAESVAARGDLLLATTNPGKRERLRWVFHGLGLSFRELPPSIIAGPRESERSLRENAEMKASFWSARLGGLAAASDGGMSIPALGADWNARRTARAAGPGADDQARARHLLALAADLVGSQRAVFWTEALALAEDGELLASWEAGGTQAFLLEGFDPPELRPGFWAASLCQLPSLGTTLAALTPDQMPAGDLTWNSLRDLIHAFFVAEPRLRNRSGKPDAEIFS